MRLPFLLHVPVLTDEVAELSFAAELARGGRWPLVSQDAYMGPLYHGLVALLMRLGVGLASGRWVVFALGALTVGLTYALGASLSAGATHPPAPERTGARRAPKDPTPLHGFDRPPLAPIGWPDHLAGLVAALLMAVAFVPVVVNSHVGWSNATTPFWTTLCLLCVSEAHRRSDPRWLVWAGALGGLAVQTHPSALLVLAGGAAYVFLVHPRWLRVRWTWLALLATLVCGSNLIIYNLQTGGGSLAQARAQSDAFTGGGVSASMYAQNLGQALRMAYQLVTSSYLGVDPEQGTPALGALLRSPVAILFGLVALVALAMTARRQPLPSVVILTFLMLAPYVNRGYRYYLQARYLAPLLPLALAAVGIALAAWASHREPLPGRPGARWGAVMLLVALWVGYSGVRLAGFYAQENRAHHTSERFWQATSAIRASADVDRTVRLDRALRSIPTTGGGYAFKVLDHLLEASGVRIRAFSPTDVAQVESGDLLVLADQTELPASDRLDWVPLAGESDWSAFGPGSFRVWRAEDRKP